jgi:hypothetical protein
VVLKPQIHFDQPTCSEVPIEKGYKNWISISAISETGKSTHMRGENSEWNASTYVYRATSISIGPAKQAILMQSKHLLPT